MNFDKILPTLKAIAPTLATALGGPLAGLAVTELGKIFGIDMSQADAASQIESQLATMTPELALALKQADQQFAIDMKKLDIDILKIDAADRDSARLMARETKDWAPRVLAGWITCGLFSILGIMVFREIPGGNHDVLNILLGILAKSFGDIVSYYFGSSASSASKDNTLKQIVTTKGS